MENDNKLSRLWVVFLLAMLSCFLWGSATPAIKIGYETFGIASSDTVSIILFAGIRFFLAGILVIIVQSVMAAAPCSPVAVHRDKKPCVRGGKKIHAVPFHPHDTAPLLLPVVEGIIQPSV